MANTNRTKGHNAERLYAKFFKEFGFDKCVTARYGSRQHDDCGIDIINIPFNIQVKTGIQKAMKPSVELQNIKEKMVEHFPKDSPQHNYPKLVIHRKEPGKGKKRTELDEIVTMSFEDFTKILKMIKWDN